MKELIFIILSILFMLGFLNLAEDQNPNDFNIEISGQITNNLGETSKTTENLLVQYIRGGLIRGQAFTDKNGVFVIDGQITSIDELASIENNLEMKGPNPFNYQTSFEVSVTEPGRIIASSINGQVKEVIELPRPGIYTISYDGINTVGMDLITIQTDNWQKSKKLVNNGRSGNKGLEIENYEMINEQLNLKSAEKDSIFVTGENITDAYFPIWHEREDIFIGRKRVNQGADITSPNIINTQPGIEASLNLDDYTYNDSESSYSVTSPFIIEENKLKFSSEETGTYTANVTVIDEEDQSLTKQMNVTFNVVEGDDLIAPEFNLPDTIFGEEDKTIFLNLDESATDNKSNPENISWEIGDGSFTSTTIDERIASFTPDKDINGVDKLSATITDETGNMTNKEIVIYYESVPDAPIAVDDNFSIQYETKTRIEPLTNDTDIENNIEANKTKNITNPNNGTLTNNGDGSFEYTPNNGFSGNDNFQYEIEDAGGKKDTARVDLNITTNPNNAPVAFNDATSTEYQTPLENIDVAANDTDVDGNLDATSVVIKSGPENGSANVDANGYIDYTPNNGFSGEDIITYTIKDDKGLESNVADLTITVAEKPNEAPIANNDSASVDYQTAKTIDVLANDVDNDGNLVPSSLEVTQQPSNGNVSVSNGDIIYTPNNGFSGSDLIKYTVKDDDGAVSNVATVTINVSEKANEAPIANDDVASTAYQTSKNDIDVAANDTDVDGNLDATSVVIKSGPSNGNASVGTDGKIDYTPNNGFSGNDIITYTIKDSEGLESNVANLTITVSEDDNVAPIANNDNAVTKYNTQKTIDVLANDSDSDGSIDATSVNITTQPINGSASTNPTTGAITYNPNNGYSGTETIQYTVKDNEGKTSNIADLVIRVNEPPIANNDATSTAYETQITINQLANDEDNDGSIDQNSVNITQDPSNGNASIDTNGRIIYTPNNGFSGNDEVRYTVMDNDGDVSNEGIITITVEEKPNEAPIANNDAVTTAYETVKNDIDVAANDTDVDNNLDATSVTIVSGPSNGSASVDANGYIDYTPNNGFSGNDNINYTIKDLEGLVSNQATLTITVEEKPNEAPIANNDAVTTAYETAKNDINVAANDTDVDDNLDLESVVIKSGPANGTASVDANGYIDYTPNNGYSGTDQITYTIKDLEGLESNQATLTITVEDKPNEAPTAVNDSKTTAYETSTTIDVLANDNDSDGSLDKSSVTVKDNPANGTIQSINTTTGAINYLPNNGFSGNDDFTYTVKDNQGAESNIATVSITVEEYVNQRPLAVDDNATAQEDVTKEIDVLANDSDDKGLNPASVNVITPPAHGSTSVNTSTGAISYTTAQDEYTDVFFEYVVADNDGAKDTARVTIDVLAVNDPVEFTGTNISDLVMDVGEIRQVDLKPIFDDKEYTDEQLSHLLESYTLGQSSISNAVMTITGESAGSQSVRVKASDEEYDAFSNYFNITVNEVAQLADVTFKMRAASTDQDLNTGTSTLRYKKMGEADYTVLTSTNGIFNVQMEKNVQYEVDASHSDDIETFYGVGSTYLALKRVGGLEAFEQRAGDDASSPVTITADNDVILVYKLKKDFPLWDLRDYASEDQNGLNSGTRKFSTSDANAPIWWDKNYENYTAEQRQWITELTDDLTSKPHVYLSLPFQEGTTAPGSPHIRLAVDESFPGPGTNSTVYNSNHEITQGQARYPISFSEVTFKIEILQAIGDLNDVGGQRPDIVNPESQGYTLNTTGSKIFSVMYLFQPKTKF